LETISMLFGITSLYGMLYFCSIHTARKSAELQPSLLVRTTMPNANNKARTTVKSGRHAKTAAD
jgi:hypothetical protein